MRTFLAAALAALAISLVPAKGAPARTVTVEDDLGPVDLEAPAQRVIALTWSTAEMVLGSGATPLAIADVEGYRTWVRRPELPEGVADVGLRNEPSLERIAELDPDLIIASDDQETLVPRLAEIAPVLFFDLFSREHDNFEAGREAFLTVAKAMGQEDEGRKRLAALDSDLADLKEKVSETFGEDRPKVTPIRFMTTATVRVYAENALATHALESVGLQHAWPQKASDWGIAHKKTEDLAAIEDGVVIYIEPFDEKEELFAQPLWKFMPFVRSGDFTSIPPVWTYGGPLSVGYLAGEMVDALMDLKAGEDGNP